MGSSFRLLGFIEIRARARAGKIRRRKKKYTRRRNTESPMCCSKSVALQRSKSRPRWGGIKYYADEWRARKRSACFFLRRCQSGFFFSFPHACFSLASTQISRLNLIFCAKNDICCTGIFHDFCLLMYLHKFPIRFIKAFFRSCKNDEWWLHDNFRTHLKKSLYKQKESKSFVFYMRYFSRLHYF